VRPGRPSLARAAVAVLIAGAPWVHAGDELAKPPLSVPLFDGNEKRTHLPPTGELQRPTVPDYRRLYHMAVACWPAKSWFRGDLYLEARASTRDNHNASVDAATGNITPTGSRYVALVARIPLISATELDKERAREAERHGKIADAVGELVSSFAERVMQTRQLELTQALEKRAQERVRLGVAETAEQVRYLEQVSALEAKITTLQAAEIKARLHIVSVCDERKMAAIDAYLNDFNRVR
jgi:hypothetical protein